MPESSVNSHLEAEIRKEPAFKIALLDAATVAKRYAREFDRQAHAPWMPRGGHGRSSQIEVVQEEGETLLANFDYAAAIVEFGSKNNPPHAPLRRGVRAAGLRLAEAPRP